MVVLKAKENFLGDLVSLALNWLVIMLLGHVIMYNFCFRLDYQARPYVRGASAFRRLVARLPPRAHSVYYRDEIGNISTSSLWGDSKKVNILIVYLFINCIL